jgi:hypothetical protein
MSYPLYRDIKVTRARIIGMRGAYDRTACFRDFVLISRRYEPDLDEATLLFIWCAFDSEAGTASKTEQDKAA